MNKQQYLLIHKNIVDGQVVLDLACAGGESTAILESLNAKHIYAVDARQNLIDKARKHVTENVDFFVHDITDYNFLAPLVEKSHTIVCLGVFYHLFDHFRFLSKILRPNIKHVLIETVCGPESMNPEMFWGFEITGSDYNGWLEGVSMIPNGTPNLSWIVQSAQIFGFDLDWLHYYGIGDQKSLSNITIEEYTAVAGPDWPPYSDIISFKNVPASVFKELNQMLTEYPRQHRRMILKLYNTEIVDSFPLQVKQHYSWPK